MAELKARDGDSLVVTYQEVKAQIAPFWTVGVGGLIYTRKLVANEDPQAQYDQIYGWLKKNAEKDAREKISAWHAELEMAAKAAERKSAIAREPKPVTPPPLHKPSIEAPKGVAR